MKGPSAHENSQSFIHFAGIGSEHFDLFQLLPTSVLYKDFQLRRFHLTILDTENLLRLPIKTANQHFIDIALSVKLKI